MIKSVEQIRAQLANGEFEFSRHGFRRAVERNISEREIREAGENAEQIMDKCSICGANEFKQELVSEIFEVDGQPVLVENIPARVCLNCGDVTFSRETTEQVRKLLHGEAKPTRTVQMNVFAFA